MEDRSSRRVRRALQTPDCTDLQDTECPLERQNCLSRSTLTWLCQCLASQQVGRTKLQLERGGQLLPLCEFDVSDRPHHLRSRDVSHSQTLATEDLPGSPFASALCSISAAK